MRKWFRRFFRQLMCDHHITNSFYNEELCILCKKVMGDIK